METVKIGKQEWSSENLNVDHFNNGDVIQQVESAEDWLMYLKEKTPACCYYDNDSANGTKYGKLYNWYAINDPRGLAPKGYHIPSDEEWTELIDYLDGVPSEKRGSKNISNIAGPKMKNDSGWNKSKNGTNDIGFSALPTGKRSGFDANFANIGEVGYWWSSTEDSRNHADYQRAYGRSISEEYSTSNGCISKETEWKESGFSVRCLKD